eukprot:g83434.t1
MKSSSCDSGCISHCKEARLDCRSTGVRKLIWKLDKVANSGHLGRPAPSPIPESFEVPVTVSRASEWCQASKLYEWSGLYRKRAKRARKAPARLTMEKTEPKKRKTATKKAKEPKAKKAKKEGGKPKKGFKKNGEPKAKRGKSAFMFYSIEMRPKVVKDHPELGFGEVAKKMGADWADLPEAKKKKYYDLAAKDKAAAQKANAKK